MDNFTQPVMPGGIIGNGKILASIRPNGELHRLFWPHIDWGQHMGILMVGVQVPPHPTLWLGGHGWRHSQRYIPDTNILVTELAHDESGLQVEQTDAVLISRDVLIRSYNIVNTWDYRRQVRLVAYSSFTINDSEMYDGMYVEPGTGTLVQYRRDVYLGLTAGGIFPLGFHCGRRNTPSDPFEPACRGEFWGGFDNIKFSAGAMIWEVGAIDPGSTESISLYLAAAHDAPSLSSTISCVTRLDARTHFEDIKNYWQGWLGGSAKPLPDHKECSLYKRSLLAIKLMSDRETGGSVAAPEFDQHYIASGGYGYCWPRDGVFVAAALDEAGHHHEAAHFYRFAVRAQNPDGSWNQRYFMNGGWAPTWGRQIDQAGAVLWGYYHHFVLTKDDCFIDEIWPSLMAGANYLASQTSTENGLPLPGMDIWEDEYSQSTYSAAAVWGGMKGAASLARVKGERDQVRNWEAVAERIKDGILRHQWSSELNRFAKSVNRRVCQGDYHYAREQGLPAREIQIPNTPYFCYTVPRNNRIDAALLGLCFPFGVLPAGDPRMEATAGEIRRLLGNYKVGGIHRYEGDGYAGGNPWVLLTLWLSIYNSLKGDTREAANLIKWAENNASPTGLLPEQVHKDHGGPAWVLPLNWSHAMYLLACLAKNEGLKGFEPELG